MDILERHADMAQKVAQGLVSPGVAQGSNIARFSSAVEIRARRKFNAALSVFRSEIQDSAALSNAFNTELLRFLSIVDEHAPTIADWDAAMARKAGKQ